MLQNNDLLVEYLPIAVFFGIATLVSVVVTLLPKILATEKPQKDKLSAYECGFEAFL